MDEGDDESIKNYCAHDTVIREDLDEENQVHHSEEDQVHHSDDDQCSFNSSLDDFDCDEENDEFDRAFHQFSYEELDYEELEKNRQDTFRRGLIGWIFDVNPQRSAINSLLKLLRTQENLRYLPRTYKTLLKTPRKVELKEMKPGKYFHCGFEEGIISSLSSFDADPDTFSQVKIFVNVDGTPLTESSRSDFWPILGKKLFLILMSLHTISIISFIIIILYICICSYYRKNCVS